jgi:hypothetical protein
MIPAFAIQAGHFTALAVSAVMLGAYGWNLLDPAVAVIGLTWLLARPSLGPVLLLSLYQGGVAGSERNGLGGNACRKP